MSSPSRFLARFSADKALPYLLCLGAVFIALAENDLHSVPFTFLIGAMIAGGAYIATRRSRFSLFFALAVLMLSVAVSLGKRKFFGNNAHVFDLRFYFGRIDALTYLADEARPIVIVAALVMIAFLAIVIAVYRWDRPSAMPRSYALGATVLAAVLTPLAFPPGGDELPYHFRRAHFASSFFASISDLIRLTKPDPLAERLAAAHDPAAGFPAASRCTPQVRPPDIFLVLSESAVLPSSVPGWRVDPGIDDLFRSYDGEVHLARVETHGGGTWVSHTSALTGLSMADFGWIKPYVTMLLEGRLRHTLPTALSSCGYKTAIITSSTFHYLNEGSMFKSIGFEDYLDRRALGAPGVHIPDEFYFDKALEYYSAHIEKDGRPLFLFIQTNAAHMPYQDRFLPERRAKGEPFGNDPETDEYLRREIFAQEDYHRFIDTLATRRGDRPALVAEFGDHHPFITRAPYEKSGVELDTNNFRSPLFVTPYSVEPLGFKPPVGLPRVEALDLAFLGVTLMETAGLPLDPVFEAQRALRDHCAGAFHTCDDRPSVDRFLTRMVRSGHIIAPQFNAVAPTAHAGP